MSKKLELTDEQSREEIEDILSDVYADGANGKNIERTDQLLTLLSGRIQEARKEIKKWFEEHRGVPTEKRHPDSRRYYFMEEFEYQAYWKDKGGG